MIAVGAKTAGGSVGTDVEEAISRFVELPDGVAADRALNRIITDLYPPIRVWAARSAHRLGLRHRGQDVCDELAQISAIAIAQALAQARTRSELPSVASWGAYLHRISQNEALHHVQNPKFTGVIGSTGQERRARWLARAHNELIISLQRTPTAEEILRHHNGAALTRRGVAGASKSGELATISEAQAVMRSAA